MKFQKKWKSSRPTWESSFWTITITLLFLMIFFGQKSLFLTEQQQHRWKTSFSNISNSLQLNSDNNRSTNKCSSVGRFPINYGLEDEQNGCVNLNFCFIWTSQIKASLLMIFLSIDAKYNSLFSTGSEASNWSLLHLFPDVNPFKLDLA